MGMPDTPMPAGPIEAEGFRAAVERAGLGDVPADDLALLRHYYVGWRAQVAQLRLVLDLTDEPATIFVAAPPPAAAAPGALSPAAEVPGQGAASERAGRER
jgi:hypothetical protein